MRGMPQSTHSHDSCGKSHCRHMTGLCCTVKRKGAAEHIVNVAETICIFLQISGNACSAHFFVPLTFCTDQTDRFLDALADLLVFFCPGLAETSCHSFALASAT